jgi:iron complex outermembrane receptor protein
MRTTPFLIAITAVAATSAAAQQPTTPPPTAGARDSAVGMPQVTVTATRNPASILATPIAVTKLSPRDLRGVNGFGLDEALEKVPGVIAQSRYGTSDIRLMIRGFGARGAGDRSNSGTSRGVRILLDGFPETEPDGRTALDQLDLAAAEAVEVIRSNASSAWGNAAGGVVNVISAPIPGERTWYAQTVLGSHGLARHVVRVATPLGGDPGNGMAFATFTNTGFDGWREHSSARRALLNLGAYGHVGTKTRLGMYLAAANNLMHVPGPLTQAQVDANPAQANATYLQRDERRYNRSGRLGVSVDHDVDASSSLSAQLYVNPKYLQRSERNTYRDFTRYHFGGNAIARKLVRTGSWSSRLTAGVDAAYQDGAILFYNLSATQGRGTSLADNKGEGAKNLGAFLQDELSVTDRVSFLLGARWDQVQYNYRSYMPSAPVPRDSRDFSKVSPKLGVNWRVGATRTHALYANVGGGIEVPAGNETDPTPGAPPALLNPLLAPIRTTSYEAGFKSVGVLAGPLAMSWDVALYDIEVADDAIPYASGRYYASAGKGRRQGVELGLAAQGWQGVFASAAITASRNRYLEYFVDSAVIAPNDPTKAGTGADYGGNAVIGIPSFMANAELGTALPGVPALRVKAGLEHSGGYFADDANRVRVPGYTLLNVGAELRDPILAGGASGLGIRGFVTVRNVTNKRYIGSAFLNPDLVGGAPAAFEPGMPRSLVVSLSVGRIR